MAKTKISEWSTTPASNTDIDGINIAEGCAPSGINDAIRDLMAQVRSWQSGASGDPFNGPMNGTIGATTAYSGAFTTVSATGVITSTLATGTAPLTIASTTKVTNLNADLLDGADWASPAALGSTTPAAVSATTLSASGAVTLSGGTANGVTYLNGSKVLTSGSALTFNGSVLYTNGKIGVGETNPTALVEARNTSIARMDADASAVYFGSGNNYPVVFKQNDTEGMRLTSTGLGIGTSSPAYKLDVSKSATGLLARFSGLNNAVAVYTDSTLGGFSDSTGQYGLFNVYSAGSATATTIWTANSERLRVDSSGNVGIGTSSLVSRLTVKASGGTYATGSLALVGSSSGTSYITNAGGTLYVSNDGSTDQLVLNSAGNLGLGVTPSAWVSSTKAIEIGASSSLSNIGTTTGVTLGSNVYYNAGWKYKLAAETSALYTQYNGTHSWSTTGTTTGTAGSAISFTQAMTLDASGNLGVGTTSPVVRVHVAGRLRVVEDTSIADLGSSTTGVYLYNRSNSALSFGTNDTERARIDSSGNLLVAKTALSGTSIGFQFKATGELNSGMAASTNSDSTLSVYSTGASAYRFYVGLGGTVYATSTTITAISDQRLKENIRDLDEGLATVMALKPRKFDWKAGKGQDIKNARGFIAQEFETVLPDMIETWRDPAPEGEEPYKAINANLIPTLVKALQEQQAIIESLKARLDAANL